MLATNDLETNIKEKHEAMKLACTVAWEILCDSSLYKCIIRGINSLLPVTFYTVKEPDTNFQKLKNYDKSLNKYLHTCFHFNHEIEVE